MRRQSGFHVIKTLGILGLAAVLAGCTTPADTMKPQSAEHQVKAERTSTAVKKDAASHKRKKGKAHTRGAADESVSGGVLSLEGRGVTSVMYCVPGRDCFFTASEPFRFVRGYTVKPSDECPAGCVKEMPGEVDNRISVTLTPDIIAVNHQAVVDVQQRSIELAGKQYIYEIPDTGTCADAAPMNTTGEAVTELCGIKFTWEPVGSRLDEIPPID